jgi:hypothetical protein
VDISVEAVRSIFSEISNCTSLAEFSFSSHKKDFSSCWDDAIFNISKSRIKKFRLDVEMHEMKADEYSTILKSQFLEEVTIIRQCKLGAEERPGFQQDPLISIHPAECPELKILFVSVYDIITSELSAEIQMNNALENLYLEYISLDQAVSLFAALKQNQTLGYLSCKLQSNEKFANYEFLEDYFISCQGKLEILELGGISLVGKSVKRFFRALVHNSHLLSISFSSRFPKLRSEIENWMSENSNLIEMKFADESADFSFLKRNQVGFAQRQKQPLLYKIMSCGLSKQFPSTTLQEIFKFSN